MNTLNFCQKAFVEKLVKSYGYRVQDTYKEIARKIGGMSYGTVRNHLLRLEKLEYIQIENRGKYHQVYNLNADKIKEIFNER